MQNHAAFEELDGRADNMATHEKEDRLVMVSFRIPVGGRLIDDSFMWPVDNRDVLQIKLFAVSILGDLFGAAFTTLDPREIEFFCIHVVYIVQREVELCLHPDNNFRALVMDGVVGAGLGLSR